MSGNKATCDYDTTPLRRLPSMRYLADLRVAGRPLDTPTVNAIARCDLVSHLTLANTNVTDAGLNELADYYQEKYPMLLTVGTKSHLLPLVQDYLPK